MTILAMRFLKDEETDYGDAVGEIQIGDFVERFHMNVSHWSPSQYVEHWRDSLLRLASGSDQGCLLTSIVEPSSRDGRVFWWLYYRHGDDAVLQNHLLLMANVDRPFVPAQAEKLIPRRRVETADGRPISEWRIPLEGLEAGVQIKGRSSRY